MSQLSSGLTSLLAEMVLPVLMVALLLSLMRLVRGPSLADRVVALELISTLSVAIIAVSAIVLDEPVFLRAAIAVALLSFLGTVAFAYYLEKRGTP